MLVPFACNLYIMIFTDAPMEICYSIIVPGDIQFQLMPCIQIHGPLSLHVKNTFCTDFALHLLATYYFLVVSGVYCLVLS